MEGRLKAREKGRFAARGLARTGGCAARKPDGESETNQILTRCGCSHSRQPSRAAALPTQQDIEKYELFVIDSKFAVHFGTLNPDAHRPLR